jgi:hypothetical protein
MIPEIKTESDLQQAIMIEGPHHHCILMRNNSGALPDATGRFVRYGLGNVSKQHSDRIKSSDLIGFTRIVITPDMVGRTVAVFTAVEIKEPGWTHSPKDKRANAQKAFTDWVKACGGFAGIVDSVEAFRKMLGK